LGFPMDVLKKILMVWQVTYSYFIFVVGCEGLSTFFQVLNAYLEISGLKLF
jgi:hypothetical protein